MPISHYIAASLITLNAAWMAFDGLRALALGDYITSSSGPRAGQLGPWASVLQSAGLPPRSTAAKTLIASVGLLSVAVAVCFFLRLPHAYAALLIAACASLWYIPFGTLLGFLAIVLLLLPRLHAAY